MKSYILFLCSLLSFSAFSQKMYQTGEWCSENKKQLHGECLLLMPDGRGDSIDLTHAWINLDLSNAAAKLISGSCRWAFTPKLDNVPELRFDLLSLTVDSVYLNNQPVNFNRAGESILIPIASPLAAGTVNDVEIFYQGSPQKDGSGWGGFYFDGQYAFNLGVGFAADPHVFGRAWFPCFDNFTERSSYTFDIKTLPAQPAYCNGYLLTDETTPDNKRRRLWLLNNPIPSYLACVAIGPYTSFKRTYQGVNNPIPLEIAAAAADTNNVRNTFQHMQTAIETYEYWFGPYKWPKIGYSLVPFGSGAMEHATNIAIGRAFINGTLNFETLWAHELSHHWWGDLATCSTAEDMWINEGWASYCEHLFVERQYGVNAYRNAVRSNFLNILQNAHVSEGGYLAVSGVPHNLTYGTHVYNKGAVVAHNLRGYMGDDLFRQGLHTVMENTSFTDMDSHEFRDKLEVSTGLDLDDFFKNWVFLGGFPDFLVDSFLVSEQAPGSFDSKIFVKQKLRGAPDFFNNVPLEFTLVDENDQRQYQTELVSNETDVIHLSSTFAPKYVFVNTNLRLTLARSDGEKMLKTTGASNFSEAKMNWTINTLGADSVFVRVEHHFATPDTTAANPDGFTLSNRFWQVHGDFPAGFNAQATITYDGRGQADQLDKELFDATSASEDDVVLLYRPGAGHNWKEWPTYTKVPLNSSTDKFGQLRILNIQAGQYAIAKGDSSVGGKEPARFAGKIEISPNPNGGTFQLKSEQEVDFVQVINSEGQIVKELSVNSGNEHVLISPIYPLRGTG